MQSAEFLFRVLLLVKLLFTALSPAAKLLCTRDLVFAAAVVRVLLKLLQREIAKLDNALGVSARAVKELCPRLIIHSDPVNILG